MSRNIRTKQKKHKILKSFSIFVAFVLIIGATVAITLALLNKTTEEVTNTFVGNSDLEVDIGEPEWDPTPFPEPDPELTPAPSDDPDLGKNKAENYTPGMDIGKNPILYNTTEQTIATKDDEGNALDAEAIKKAYETLKDTNEWLNACEYVAIKLDYQIWNGTIEEYQEMDSSDRDTAEQWTSVSYSDFSKLATIKWLDESDPQADGTATQKDGFSNQWTVDTSGDFPTNTIFYYNTALTPYILDGNNTTADGKNTILMMDGKKLIDYKTDPLFDSVLIDITLDQDTELTFTELDSSNTFTTEGLIPFRITVNGYAIQAYVDRVLMTPPNETPAAGDNSALTELKAFIQKQLSSTADEGNGD